MKRLKYLLEHSTLIYDGCLILVSSTICGAYIHFVGLTLITTLLIALILIFTIFSIINFILSLRLSMSEELREKLCAEIKGHSQMIETSYRCPKCGSVIKGKDDTGNLSGTIIIRCECGYCNLVIMS